MVNLCRSFLKHQLPHERLLSEFAVIAGAMTALVRLLCLVGAYLIGDSLRSRFLIAVV